MMEDVETTATNVGVRNDEEGDETLPVASAVPVPMQTGEVLNFARDTTEVEEDVDNAGPTSSFENVLPMDKLKKGWAQWSVFARTQAAALNAKANELQESEQFQNFKAKTEATIKQTHEACKPYFEKTEQVVKPYVDKGLEVTAPYVAKAQENAAILGEKARPHIEAAVQTTQEFINKVAVKAGAGRQPQGENMTV